MTPHNNAVYLALTATAIVALTGALTKAAAQDVPILEILFFRQMGVLASTLPALLRTKSTLRTAKPALHSLRLLGAFIALSFGIWALAVLPLTTAITLSFLQVVFVALLAPRFLGEPASRHRVLATGLGLAGVAIFLNPTGFTDIRILIPLIGAFGAAVALLTVRRLSKTESTDTLLVYQAIFIGALTALPMLWLWVTPSLPTLALLLGIGALATISQRISIRALRIGEATVVANIGYTQILYAAFFGALWFGESLSMREALSAGLIIAAALLTSAK